MTFRFDIMYKNSIYVIYSKLVMSRPWIHIPVRGPWRLNLLVPQFAFHNSFSSQFDFELQLQLLTFQCKRPQKCLRSLIYSLSYTEGLMNLSFQMELLQIQDDLEIIYWGKKNLVFYLFLRLLSPSWDWEDAQWEHFSNGTNAQIVIWLSDDF